MESIMKNKVTIKLNGSVTLSDFSKVIENLSGLIDELTDEVGDNAEINWEITKLESGSAYAEIIGSSFYTEAVEKIVSAYSVIGNAIENNLPIPYSQKIAHKAREITHVINQKISSIVMGTDDGLSTINRSVEHIAQEEIREYSFGTVTGTVETLSKHDSLQFTLYDNLFNKAVHCHLKPEQADQMIDAWDKRVTVAGKVFRDVITGRPYKIVDISYIERNDSSAVGSFKKARGVLRRKNRDELPEVTIRRFRDA